MYRWLIASTVLAGAFTAATPAMADHGYRRTHHYPSRAYCYPPVSHHHRPVQRHGYRGYGAPYGGYGGYGYGGYGAYGYGQRQSYYRQGYGHGGRISVQGPRVGFSVRF